ncbi:hypothetical protein GCM10011452_38570 [Gemmobacter lanyuensis]|uniref:Uncharacterized protein n=1 Tax=Gemmobacter lanyuensis TaxID=1054497 RepID=A0A918MQW9_9RHOB|nr:hypothetical protein GCM10011452_38570 [Gemmobacter lanyuensis]
MFDIGKNKSYVEAEKFLNFAAEPFGERATVSSDKVTAKNGKNAVRYTVGKPI